MNTQTIVLLIGLGLFFILSAIEIFYGFIEDEKNRKIWKVFPAFVLSFFLMIAFPNYPLVYLAVLLGFFGDLLLIWERNKVIFLIGGVCFFIGHLLYLLEIIFISNLNLLWYGYLGLVLGFVVLFALLFIILRKKIGGAIMVLFASAYFYILILNFVLSIIALITTKNYYLIFVSIGYLMFVVSDTMLSYKLFIKEYKMDDFYIMSAYLLAQLFISIGLLLPFLS